MSNPRLSQQQQQPSPAFWDSISKLWLGGRALKELERRNPSVRPATVVQPDLTQKEVLDHIKLKRFGRRGGPDLSDLRRVRTDNDKLQTVGLQFMFSIQCLQKQFPQSTPLNSTRSTAAMDNSPSKDHGRRASAYDGNFSTTPD